MTSSHRPPGDSDVAFFAELRARLRQAYPSRESAKGSLMPRTPPVRVVPPPPVPSPSDVNHTAEYAAAHLARAADELAGSILTGKSGHGIEAFAALAKSDPLVSADAAETVADLRAFANACASFSRRMEVAKLRAHARCAQLMAQEAQEKAVRAAEALAQSMTINRKDNAQ
jgi:hypothetical protein